MARKNDKPTQVASPIALQVTLRDLVESNDALTELSQQKLPARTSFTLGLVLQAITPHFQSYNKTRRALLEQYGKPIEGTTDQFRITPDHRAEFQREHDELLDTPLTLHGIGKIRASHFTSDAKVELTAQNIYALRWLLKNDIESVFEPESEQETSEN